MGSGNVRCYRGHVVAEQKHEDLDAFVFDNTLLKSVPRPNHKVLVVHTPGYMDTYVTLLTSFIAA